MGYVFGSSTRGQRALYEVGLTGIPISNCNNNCSTGSSAVFLTRSLVAGGLARCALALGFEKMQVGSTTLFPFSTTIYGTTTHSLQKGALSVDEEGVSPLDKHMAATVKFAGGPSDAPPAPWMFALAGQEHSKRSATVSQCSVM